MQHHALFSLRSEGDLKAEEPQLYEKNYFILMLMIQSIKQVIFHLVEAAFAYFEADSLQILMYLHYRKMKYEATSNN